MPLFGKHSQGDNQAGQSKGVKKMRTKNAADRNRQDKVQQTKGTKHSTRDNKNK